MRILQIRHKGSWDAATFAACESIAAMCREFGATLVINDRADIARMLDAPAVHVGQEDLPPAMIRAQAPDLAIGFSTHTADQLRAVPPEADYAALGPIFDTASKANPSATVGLEMLREWRGFTSLPLVAIGGITRASAPAVFDAGADSVAVIHALFAQPLTSATLKERVHSWLPLN
jgi:thiamine-phosphate pyrophosphorylase